MGAFHGHVGFFQFEGVVNLQSGKSKSDLGELKGNFYLYGYGARVFSTVVVACLGIWLIGRH
ncbi:hypothetical protein AXFE_16450 [Acidithrix ferrooxidans]|uniref:Uncharacterized protein n=1 Tax=Acidithrix ferrooxidans TaxID=1280514 RepID=A0A0D8HI94_9ACTN|nr:hypothetical protein AXFE_16450 [Acidithrix ferrooxidans]CAG4929565.1 unnamed protein product [Acidithrix sp. C25]